MSTQIRRPNEDRFGGDYWDKSGGSTRYANVNEETSDGDTSYIYRKSSYSGWWYCQFGHEAFSIGNETVNTVKLYITAKCPTTSGTAYLQGGISVGADLDSSNLSTAPAQAFGDSYQTKQYEFLKNPATGTDWTYEELEHTDLTLSHRLIGSGPRGADGAQVRVTQVYLEATYEG